MLNISCKMGNGGPETEKGSEGGSFYSELSRVHCVIEEKSILSGS